MLTGLPNSPGKPFQSDSPQTCPPANFQALGSEHTLLLHRPSTPTQAQTTPNPPLSGANPTTKLNGTPPPPPQT